MNGIFAALASIATAAATQATARTIRHFAWTAIAAVLILIAVGFGASAGFEALEIAYGSLVAKLIVGGVFLLAGLIILVVVNFRKGRARRAAPVAENSTTAAVAFAMGLLSGLGRRR